MMTTVLSVRSHRAVGNLGGIVFVLTFITGALCGFFAAYCQCFNEWWTLSLPMLCSGGELRTLIALSGAYSLMLLCACARPARPVAFALSGVFCAACVYCAACFWRTWGNAGFYLSCWLLLPRLLMCVLIPLLCWKPNIFAVLVAPAVLSVQFLLYPVFSMSFAQMI